MSKKNNEDKLKILQKRLAEIQNNQEKKAEKSSNNANRKKVAKSKSYTKKQGDNTSKDIKKTGGALKIILIILGSLIIIGGLILGIIFWYFMADSPTNLKNSKGIIYHKEQWNEDHSHLIILNTYDTSEIKFAEIENQNFTDKFADLNIECGLFFLPEMTNKKDSLVYQTYLGPFFSAKEAEQYYQLINPKKDISDTQMGDFKPIKLGTIIKLK
ncbi:MAG: hypothetical protein CMP51_01380 [Flavobacteriales bacterium]|nr:hypothetical protein [Flavobacteriales bacterium]|tara:strand:+ start:53 stop:694 length:642 start_codon:yes stop_codon:yes gene_type:complete